MLVHMYILFVLPAFAAVDLLTGCGSLLLNAISIEIFLEKNPYFGEELAASLNIVDGPVLSLRCVVQKATED